MKSEMVFLHKQEIDVCSQAALSLFPPFSTLEPHRKTLVASSQKFTSYESVSLQI